MFPDRDENLGRAADKESTTCHEQEEASPVNVLGLEPGRREKGRGHAGHEQKRKASQGGIDKILRRLSHCAVLR